MKKNWTIFGGIVGILILLTGVALWQTRDGPEPASWVKVSNAPQGIMGTSCRLEILVAPGDEAAGEEALALAEARLREIEALTSNWMEDSEVSRLNRLEPGQMMNLAPETYAVVEAAKMAFERTGGAFDATCRPLIEVWKGAGQSGKLPDGATLAGAKAQMGWQHITLGEGKAGRVSEFARLDLGGIAKGYAIDEALAAMRAMDVGKGGLVDVGGDLAAWMDEPVESDWMVEIRDPFAKDGEVREVFGLRGGGVATSGNYARFSEIEGKRYSHIIDPRTGYPAEAVPSVTVTAPSALEADIWATALNVLGVEEGLARLPAGYRAVFILEDEVVSR